MLNDCIQSSALANRKRFTKGRKLANHYHVLVGFPGYVPNSNYPCETLKEAGDVAYATADTFRDDGHKVVGNKRNGYEVLRPRTRGLLVSHTIGWNVWQTITIAHCNEADCRCVKCGTLLEVEDAACRCMHL